MRCYRCQSLQRTEARKNGVDLSAEFCEELTRRRAENMVIQVRLLEAEKVRNVEIPY